MADKMIRVGKPMAAWFHGKEFLFSDDEGLLAHSMRIAEVYRRQPRRGACKICASPIGKVAFVKQGIAYSFCHNCNHLNGLHEDTDEFAKAVYTESESEIFERAYSDIDEEVYCKRVEEVYRPKAEFLLSALREQGEEPSQLKYADFGSGGGYFISGMQLEGVRYIQGYEVSRALAEHARRRVGGHVIVQHEIDELAHIIEGVDADVVSLIFVLEHLQNPQAIFQAINNNRRIKYMFVSVPMFSLSVFIEMAFQNSFHRNLSDGHTHLFTHRSLSWLCSEMGMSSVAEWWFGSDMIDLYRLLGLTLQQDEHTAPVADIWFELMRPLVDDMQLQIDKRMLSSDIHVVLRKANISSQ